MRKHSLRHEANIYLSNRQGSPRERKYRRYVILKMINDLFTTGELPPHWYAINATHLQRLVKHWQKQKLNPSTMMNYMTIIRKFLTSIGNCVTSMDNQSLGITANKKIRKNVNIPLERWQKINDPLAKLLLNLQIYFGLMLREAMRLIPGVHVRDNTLWVTRDITFNSMDRVIPIRSDTQAKIIEEFNLITHNQHTLISMHGYRTLCFRWNTALKTLRIPVKKSCRYLYAQLTFKQLTSSYTTDSLTKLLMNEMGLKSRSSVWSYLHNE